MLTWGKSLNLKLQGRRPVESPSGHHLTILGDETLILITSSSNSEAVSNFRSAARVNVGYLSFQLFKVNKTQKTVNFLHPVPT